MVYNYSERVRLKTLLINQKILLQNNFLAQIIIVINNSPLIIYKNYFS